MKWDTAMLMDNRRDVLGHTRQNQRLSSEELHRSEKNFLNR